VWRLDRLSRNLRDMLVTIEDVFKANNVEFISATENIDTSSPSGRLLLNILGSVAQNERENTSVRTTMVMHELAKQAKHLGGRPLYGYAVDQDMHYVLDPVRAEAVRLIFRMRAAGHSYPEIISALDNSESKIHGISSREIAETILK
jgi:site-specific DNA recombinase